MILDIISIERVRRKRKVKFTETEHLAIKIMSEQQLGVMRKQENPDDNLKRIISILESVHEKVKHIK